jgi:hypothetical protein
MKSVDRVVLGLPVRGEVGTRIRAVLADLGIHPATPAEAKP